MAIGLEPRKLNDKLEEIKNCDRKKVLQEIKENRIPRNQKTYLEDIKKIG